MSCPLSVGCRTLFGGRLEPAVRRVEGSRATFKPTEWPSTSPQLPPWRTAFLSQWLTGVRALANPGKDVPGVGARAHAGKLDSQSMKHTPNTHVIRSEKPFPMNVAQLKGGHTSAESAVLMQLCIQESICLTAHETMGTDCYLHTTNKRIDTPSGKKRK